MYDTPSGLCNLFLLVTSRVAGCWIMAPLQGSNDWRYRKYSSANPSIYMSLLQALSGNTNIYGKP